MNNQIVKESLHITNIGPLTDIKIDRIKPVTVFIGESASGKSCVIKIIALFRYLFKVATVRAWLKSAGIRKNPFRIKAAKHWKNCGMSDMITNVSTVEYTVTIGDDTYKITYKNGTFYLPQIDKDKELEYFKVSFISEYRNIIAPWLENNIKPSPDRLGFYFSETLNEFVNATIDENEIFLPHVSLYLRMVKDAFGSKKYKIVNKSKESPYILKFQDSASGIQASAPIIANVKYLTSKFDFKTAFNRSVLHFIAEEGNLSEFKPKTDINDMQKWLHIHIEEPELGLFPDAQIKLFDELLQLINLKSESLFNTTLMLTTHSPYLLNYLNLLIVRRDNNKTSINPNDIAVYRVYDGELQNLVSKTQTGRTIINTFDMSEQMMNMTTEYNTLVNTHQC